MTRCIAVVSLVVVFGTSRVVAQSPCDKAASEVARAGCIDSLYARADTELNLVYQLALAGLTDTAQRRLLVISERAWVAEKEAQEKLLFAFAYADGGNHQGERVLPELMSMTQARMQFLKTQVLSRVAQPLVSRPPASLQESAILASLKSDLRNLVTAEEAFFADSLTYTSRFGPGGIRFAPSGANTWPRITAVKDGWIATMGNPGSPRTCVMWVGQIPNHPASPEGSPTCP